MAPKAHEDPLYLDEHHQRISEFASDYFDDDDEREAFVTELMSRRGYKQRTTVAWDPPDPPQDPRQQGSPSPAGGSRKPSYFRK